MSDRQILPVYFTEVNYELALFLTVEEQGADLKESLCTYGSGRLEEAEKADLFEVPDAEVADWLVRSEIGPENVSWGESFVRLPAGWRVVKDGDA
jgi:hypothetical protein